MNKFMSTGILSLALFFSQISPMYAMKVQEEKTEQMETKKAKKCCSKRLTCCEKFTLYLATVAALFGIPTTSSSAVFNNVTCPLMDSSTNLVVQRCKSSGGITISPMNSIDVEPKQGIVVALHGCSKIVPAREFFEKNGEKIVEQYIKDHSDLLSDDILSLEVKSYKPYLGAWHNKGDDQIYLDMSVVFNNKDKQNAIEFCKKQDQIAAYDLSQGEEIPCGGSGKI